METKRSTVIPFCIYHYIDRDTSTYYGFIGAPQLLRTLDNTIQYRCQAEPKTVRGWEIAYTFYAISPMIRPIPYGMHLFCAQKVMGYPYNMSDMYRVSDSYEDKSDCVYFITYSQPVPNTVPLYFHKRGQNIFPSFDSKPPSQDEWITTTIPILYVMTTKTVGPDPYAIRFRCINGRCIPWTPTTNLPVYAPFSDDKLLELRECVLYCSAIGGDNNTKPLNILDLIAKDIAHSQGKDVKSDDETADVYRPQKVHSTLPVSLASSSEKQRSYFYRIAIITLSILAAIVVALFFLRQPRRAKNALSLRCCFFRT